MNILPKKRWHVRTKENIARVRKDEAEAAEKEKQERLRIENADREARLNVLKHKSKQRLLESGFIETEQEEPPTPTSSDHINLFADLDHAVQTTNKDHDKELKDKKEEYEKKIGYLTYLGQDTNEALKKKNWYEVTPDSSRYSRTADIKDTYDKLVLKDAEGKPKTKEVDEKDGEIAWKAKQRLDPLNAFKKYCPAKVQVKPHATPKDDKVICSYERKRGKNGKHKRSDKHKKNNDDKQKKLQKLREARLKREQQEKYKTDQFLSGLNGPITNSNDEPNVDKVKPKYNSQFNPELARQNYR